MHPEETPRTTSLPAAPETPARQIPDRTAGSKPTTLAAEIARSNEKLLPLFIPCYLLVLGVIALLDIDLIDPALLESANWKQNTIWCMLLLFGLLPPNLRGQKIVWMGIGYMLAFFVLGGANIYGTVRLILAAFKTVLPMMILFQAIRLGAATRKHGRWALLLPLAALVFAGLLYPIEDQNIVQSGWKSLLNWSTENYRNDNGFHTYVGIIGILAGLTEAAIVTGHLCRKKQ